MPNHNKSKRNDKHHRILTAAIKVFARHGFHPATVSEIAKEAKVADGTIYLYFENKDDILRQFFSYKAKLVFDGFKQELNRGGDAVQKLRNLIRRHLTEFQKDKDMAVVYQAEAKHNSPLIGVQFEEVSQMYLHILGDVIEQGQTEGVIRKDLYVGLAKRFILGAINEVINTWVLTGGKYDLASMADDLVDLILRGVGSSWLRNGT